MEAHYLGPPSVSVLRAVKSKFGKSVCVWGGGGSEIMGFNDQMGNVRKYGDCYWEHKLGLWRLKTEQSAVLSETNEREGR